MPCEAENKNWRYARTKAVKLAMNMQATPFRKEMLSNPDYQTHVLAREEEKIAKRKAEIEARDAAKEARPMSAKRRFLEDKKRRLTANPQSRCTDSRMTYTEDPTLCR